MNPERTVADAAAAVARKRAELSTLFESAREAEGDAERERMASQIKAGTAELEKLIDTEKSVRAADALSKQPVKRLINPNDWTPAPARTDDAVIGLKSSDRLADHIGSRSDDVGLARWLRAYITGDWDGMPEATKAMSTSAQGAVVPTPTSARVIDFARNTARVFQAGALTIPMSSSTLKVPRLLGDPTAEWKAENAALSAESDLQLDSVTFTARTLMAIVTMSVELFEDSGPEADEIVERALASALALELDRAALYGDGSPASEPTGVHNTAGVQHITASAGQPADFDDFIEAVRIVRSNNYEPNAAIMSPDAAAVYDSLKDTTRQPLRPPASYADLEKLITKQVTSDDVIVGDWARGLAVGMRTNISIEASRDAATAAGNAFDRLQVKVRAYLRADAKVLQPGAFAVIDSIAYGGS